MKDPGQQIINACIEHQSKMVDDTEFYEVRRDELIAAAAQDCTEAIIQTGENVLIEMLALIGNRARWININGDLDDKISYHDEVIKLMSILIYKHADAQASLDLERRLGEGTK